MYLKSKMEHKQKKFIFYILQLIEYYNSIKIFGYRLVKGFVTRGLKKELLVFHFLTSIFYQIMFIPNDKMMVMNLGALELDLRLEWLTLNTMLINIRIILKNGNLSTYLASVKSKKIPKTRQK